MQLYETKNYIVIIHYTDFQLGIRNVKEENLETFIKRLNEEDKVFDYVITRKIEFDL